MTVVIGKFCWNFASVFWFLSNQYRCCVNALFWFHHAQFEISTSYYTPMWPISKKSTVFGHHSNFTWLLSMVVGLGIVPSLTVKGHFRGITCIWVTAKCFWNIFLTVLWAIEFDITETWIDALKFWLWYFILQSLWNCVSPMLLISLTQQWKSSWKVNTSV